MPRPALAYTARMPLTQNQKKALRRLGHGLDPIVLVGQQGFTPGVAAELDAALAAHELVKVRARTGDRELRDQILSRLAETTSSELVFRVGNVGLFYRKNKDVPRILLPDS